MITREELLRSSEYWTEIIQNKIYNDLIEYIQDHNITNKKIAEILGLSKGRVSQILTGGNLNFRLDTLVKLCITIDKIPDFHLINVSEFLEKEKLSSYSIVFKQTEIFLEKVVQMTYKPSPKTHNYNLHLNHSGIISQTSSLTEDMNPGTKAA